MTSVQDCGCLALDVIPLFIRACHAVSQNQRCRQPNEAFLSQLAAELLLVQKRLQDAASSGDMEGLSVRKLLKNLERVYVFPSSLRSLETLHKMQAFPCLDELRKFNNIAKLKKALSLLASSTDSSHVIHRSSLLQTLSKFSKVDRKVDRDELLDLGLQSPEDENSIRVHDHSGEYKQLYQAYFRFCICQTLSCEDAMPVKAHLGLEGCENSVHSQRVCGLSVVFPAHPHLVTELECQWQEARIFPAKKEVRFSDPATPDMNVHQAIWTDNFCKYISSHSTAPVNLSLDKGRLFFDCFSQAFDGWFAAGPSICLNSLLSLGGLSRRMRLLLSTLLARAVWQFYDTQWMSKSWTKNDILFFYWSDSKSAATGIYANQPFLSAANAHDATEDATFGCAHRFPKILALGILLLEIELDIRIESKRPKHHMRSDGRVNSNTDFTTASLLLSQDSVWNERETFTLQKEVIECCLTGHKFKACDDISAIRAALLKWVVSPLQNLLSITWNGLDSSTLQPMKLPDALKPTVLTSRSLVIEHFSALTQNGREVGCTQGSKISPSLEKGLRKNDPKISTVTTGQPNYSAGLAQTRRDDSFCSTDKWWERMEDVNSILRQGRKAVGHQRVKVAILDTGIDESHPYRKHIKGYHDFVSGHHQQASDETGHGTSAVHIIFRLLPEVDIFIGRVFETDEANDTTRDLMAEAIRHARERWCVDIISLSSGFHELHEAMSSEITTCNAVGVLVLAAASNYGNIDDITFPANMTNNVICAFSSTGNVKPSDFNPAPSRLTHNNFCFLGEDVEAAEGGSLRSRGRLSGTSVATCVAAGLAAIVLDFARQQDCQAEIPNKKDLTTVGGMSAIFREMGTLDSGHICIAPWKLLDDIHDCEWDIKRKRQYICGTIFRALKHKNRR